MPVENDPAVERAMQAAQSLRVALDAVADLRITTSDPDELVRVVADGTPALAEVQLDPRVFRRPLDQVSALLVALIDEALTDARRSRREALVAALPAELRALAEGNGPALASLLTTAAVRDRIGDIEAGVQALAEEEFEGAAGEGQVVVVVTGQLQVRRITLGRNLLDHLDSALVAEHLVTATNAALAAAAARIAQLAATGPATDVSASLQAFNRRMDDLLVRLDALDRALELG